MVAWMTVLSRTLGYDGAVDYNGGGVIHQNEPTQAVFFGKHTFKEVEVIHNRFQARKDHKTNFEIWGEKPQIFINLMNKGRIPEDQIIQFLKEPFSGANVMKMLGSIKKLPEVTQNYLKQHPEEFISEFNYEMLRYIPMSDKTVLALLQSNPNTVSAMPRLSKAAQAYLMANYKKFSKDVIGIPIHRTERAAFA